jgi:hypothetical protein
LTSSESGESISSNGQKKQTKKSWWLGGKLDADDRLGRPQSRPLATVVNRLGFLGNFGSKARHRLTSWRRDENSAVTEKKKMRDRHQTSLPVYTRWRYKRNYRWVALLIACVLFFGGALMPYIDWSLSAIPTQFPTLHGDVAPAFHFTQRRLAGSARESDVPVVDRERGFKRRLRKAINSRVTQQKAHRHPVHNGLLAVNMSLPVSAHPIKQLIKDAKEKWDAKNAMQSRTLKQAVAAYKMRNRGLNPPNGFDKWWRFVV